MEHGSTRRAWLRRMSSAYGAMTLSAAGGAAIAQQSTHASSPIDPRNLPQHSGRSADEPFGYCLNTSTIRGQKLPLVKELEIASAAGFQAVEPWINEVDQFVNEGGKLGDLKKRIADLRLSVESVIAFTEWIVDDDWRGGRRPWSNFSAKWIPLPNSAASELPVRRVEPLTWR